MTDQSLPDQLARDPDLRRLIAFEGITAAPLTSAAEARQRLAGIVAAAAPRAAEVDRSGTIPATDLIALAESGLLAARVPAEFGGLGAGYPLIAEIIIGLSSASGSLGQIPQNHYHLLEAIFRHGSPEQRRFFAAELLAGKRLGNALSERNGKPVGSLPDTTLTPLADGGWRIDGRKFYATGAYTAQWIPVMARTPDGAKAMVFVPRHAQGVEVINDWDALGQRGTHSGSVSLSGVEIPALYALAPWDGFAERSTFAPYSTMIHAAIDVGIGKGAIAAAKGWITRKSRPWGASGVDRAALDPLILQRFGELGTAIDAAEALVYRSADLLTAADASGVPEDVDRAVIATAQASAFAAVAGERFASEAMSWAGASSTLAGSELARIWRDIRTHSTHDPAHWKYHRAGNYMLNGVAATQFGTRVN